ncbi:hypothetical protein AAEO56_13260 [Flavobacterium sp. DGU11]|uniref:Uncharacterized protein n=1 Tax=Flavobacterium arundinis TaxID=3139143 RepID=A0ABU9HYJ0_9FLAO
MNNSIIKNTYKSLLLFFFFMMPLLATAQEFDEGDGGGDDVNDEAPIDGYVSIALVTGCVLGYLMIKREAKLS